MKRFIQFTLPVFLGINAIPAVTFAEEGRFFLKPYLGLSALSDKDATTSGIGGADGTANIEIDGGIVSGLGFGYRYNDQFASEIAWEYRSNDSKTTLADGSVFDEGNYASNTIYLNGYYFPSASGNFRPYVGAGIGWVQEIDIDFEQNGVEQSYSGDGDVAFQFMAGVEYGISEKINFNGGLRYSTVSVDLEGEDITGNITDLDYDPLTLELGLSFLF